MRRAASELARLATVLAAPLQLTGAALQGANQHVLFTSLPQPWHRSTSYAHCRQLGFAAATALQQPQERLFTVQRPALPELQHDVFHVSLVTGNLRGAGTRSPAVLKLIGTGGSTERVLVGSDELGQFDRGSIRRIDVAVPPGFGTLRRVHLEKHRDMQATGDGWFLLHVEVEGPEGKTLFPCNAWFGESDSGGLGGPEERNLLPAVPELADSCQPSPVSVTASGMSIPHPEKVIKQNTKGHNTRAFGYGGEDAYFVTQASNGIFGMGVADGVYMWREQGIDSGLMSRMLMNVCRQQVEAGSEDVFKMLNAAASQVKEEKLLGSATACILTINPLTGQLHSANLGDSGFYVLSPADTGRDYKLRFRTNQMEHKFGCPFQIGHHEAANKVEDSDMASFFVRQGDVIVMGSDGLLDNVSDVDLQQEVSLMLREKHSSASMVQRLMKVAFEASMDRRRVTPYSQGASEAFDMVFSGGKPDDITVMVALCS
mmetsp:Transcript_10331/g.17962  ORF Transcript_10331/g.17962 Transcript_10331/m.17962 type:complete len:487 (+) Transcript_10331:106-1566(+)|eukprot:CAMPEP_0119105452 /NCGR_PEP_ID=MMETSP1180-20130426/3406_1 /TAXON_ID=3052 ORGANISM="Chlamydomonas cf sp, Strain CCMP681" /NCGR_SAMPLE_ID=MMETSP1180 /ASSEMBLY_ACC=CAM_ASM_000741 /LENGTH=486 /DNA_ID=CAMNT_0007090497 /DNA_START=68 /DNA_END=1528 /DNA_ORIENTATION=+